MEAGSDMKNIGGEKNQTFKKHQELGLALDWVDPANLNSPFLMLIINLRHSSLPARSITKFKVGWVELMKDRSIRGYQTPQSELLPPAGGLEGPTGMNYSTYVLFPILVFCSPH